MLAALNPRPPVALRLLTGRSAALPLGVWLAAGGAGGAALSAMAAALALRQGSSRPGRDGRVADNRSEPEGWSRWSAEPEPTHREPPPRRWAEPAAEPAAMPERPPGDPAPTVSVPFRVVRRPPARPGPPAEPAAAHAGASGAGGDADDWDEGASDDW